MVTAKYCAFIFVGGLLFGIIADRYGRIPALVGTNMLGFIGGIATAYSFNFISFAFSRFIVGFAFDNCFTMMYILGEYFFQKLKKEKKRKEQINEKKIFNCSA